MAANLTSLVYSWRLALRMAAARCSMAWLYAELPQQKRGSGRVPEYETLFSSWREVPGHGAGWMPNAR